MTSYIIKGNDEEQRVLLYQEKVSYSFKPKKSYKYIKKVTVLDTDMLSSIWEKRITNEYNRLIKIIYSLIESEDTTSGDVMVAYTEINRIKEYLSSLESKGLDKKVIDKYLEKLCALELELKKVHVMELESEIGKSR